MVIQIALNHKTKYSYDKAISMGPQIIRLHPAAHSRTNIVSYSLSVKPSPHFIHWQQDPHGNHIARVIFPDRIKSFSVEVDLIADMTVINPFDFFLEKSAETFPFTYDEALRHDLQPFLGAQKPGAALNKLIKSIDLKPNKTIDFLIDLNKFVHSKVKYLIRMEAGVQTSEETLKLGSGSCRDSAWLMVELLRNLGLAARFTSGYSIILKPDLKFSEDDPDIDDDFVDLHAWAEVFLPGAGWVGLDPSSGLLVGEGAIPLVSSPDPTSAAPISGELENCKVEFAHSMSIARVYESPRSTKPYSEKGFAEINKIGKLVDARLKQAGLGLTTGGEPTFVSATDMAGAEWNINALGPTKKILARKLLQELKQEWTSGALLHHGQGKWYPGEPLPRWALGCYWREDGKPIWHNEALIADETKDYGLKQEDAYKFINELTKALGLDSAYINPAYEDTLHYLSQEQKLPANVDVFDSKLTCELERKKLYQVFTAGLETVAGYALPIQSKNQAWLTCPWEFRREKLYLLPGNSPMGLRLPLNSLLDGSKEHARLPRDPMDDSNTSKLPSKSKSKVKPGLISEELIRTTLCVELREGRLYVFMPPLDLIEDYLTLVHKIEEVAEKLKLPILVEGYEPPYDNKVRVLKITPDPGVIEVNIPPNDNWDDMVTMTKSLYAAAKRTGLCAEKFMLDGKHTGTGGGNHIVMGARTPSASPFLRRPDLLASLIAYWNNHPSLSYLFSGLFVGPTSQAPRVDEGRQDSLYELEIALEQIAKSNTVSPWFVDRSLRNLLVDLTGNTHRSEFCIDKLFSPDSATGRLGLVELRGFEMTPSAEMNLAQQLLIHSLVAMFWDKPYKTKLTHWKTTLHDRFLLPYFVRQDFEDVLRDLNNDGIALNAEHYRSHFEFRFPFYGKLSYNDINIELRYAIEPWHVLGEEAAAGGTARYVDSSLERLQVEVNGLVDPRYIICCNQRKLPLVASGKEGHYVAGIRYRAWQPYSGLHPSIPVQTPLIFDIVDTVNMRAVAGCSYHVSNPSGKNSTDFPINAREAEARRSSRFFNTGHNPGIIDKIPEEEINPSFPSTLDLRRS
ncbi:MAG: transglutaminase family protein [Cyanobacteria bacterium]|nr:transglutaminase family protein [Cyanobacteriota bacterium]MDA1021213.1 transglutaminase family protein [Cyanobacteriota bacterium]